MSGSPQPCDGDFLGNSDHPSGVNWDSHESKEARWYPTCVTLADGRALIVGGSRSGSGQAFINNTYEIFEPGYYLVFILNRNGVPSKGRFVRIG